MGARLIEDARQNPVAGKENVALYAFANATDLMVSFYLWKWQLLNY